MLVRLLTCVAVSGALSLVPAQTNPRLIGLSLNPAIATTINLRQDYTTCQTQPCPLPLPLPPAGNPFAGGSAYDAAKGAIWHTNGLAIGAFHPGTCAAICPPMGLAPIIGIANLATGLALNDSTKTLWLMDNTNTLYQISSSCPLAANTKCPLAGVVIPAGMISGGLATADVQNLIFYSASNWVGAPNNTIYVASQATPCAPTCKFLLQGCGGLVLGPITGLAYDECKRVLWITDGVLVSGVQVLQTPFGCTFNQIGCCRVPAPDSYIGLCMEPSHATSVGAVCTAPTCAPCLAMSHDVVGDAALGNPSFSLQLNNAPAGATAVLCINIGTCGPGVPIPPFCGPLLVPLPGILTFGFPTGGGVGCTGGVNLTLSVPMNPALCSLPLSSQFLVVCLGAPIGTGVSNCQTWMVSGT